MDDDRDELIVDDRGTVITISVQPPQGSYSMVELNKDRASELMLFLMKWLLAQR